MANITILERDLTSAGAGAAAYDVVYVPGIAETNKNYIVYSEGSTTPTQATPGAITAVDANSTNINMWGEEQEHPQYACNIIDKITWKCTDADDTDGVYVWVPQEIYVEPKPENTPLLCTTVKAFEDAFGATPYVFTEAQAYPTFKTGALPAALTNMYESGAAEKSYIYAKELIFKGVPVIYENIVTRTLGVKDTPTVAGIYDALSDCFDKLSDKGEYTVKYITSGAYPTFELMVDAKPAAVTDKMTTIAYTRGDAVAIIDHANNPGRKLSPTPGTGSVYDTLANDTDYTIAYPEFGAMFTPWASYSCTTAPAAYANQLMPASFNYLCCLANSIQTNANWLAIAGVNRGIGTGIKTLNTIDRLSNEIADAYQPRDAVAINAITNIKPYGLTIWGNRTLSKNASGNLTATSFLNVRNLVSDIKKLAYTTAKGLVFEQNSDVLWINFKAGIAPLLEQMKSGYGISNYKIIRATTKYNGEALGKGELAAVIRVTPLYATEDWEITLVMEDGDVTVS